MENYRTTDKPIKKPPNASAETLFQWKLCKWSSWRYGPDLQILDFPRTDVLWQSCIEQAFQRHFFPTAFGHLVPLGHILRMVTVFQAFSLFCLLWWSVVSDYNWWKAQTMASIFMVLAIKYFAITVCAFPETECPCTLHGLQSSGNVSVTCAGRPNTSLDLLYCDTCFRGLGPNRQYLWDVPALYIWICTALSTPITVINPQISFQLQSSGEINVGEALFSRDHYLIFIQMYPSVSNFISWSWF